KWSSPWKLEGSSEPLETIGVPAGVGTDGLLSPGAAGVSPERTESSSPTSAELTSFANDPANAALPVESGNADRLMEPMSLSGPPVLACPVDAVTSATVAASASTAANDMTGNA